MTSFFHSFDLIESCDTGAYRLEVCKHAAEPSVGNIVFFTSLGFCLDGFLSLLLGSHEEDRLSFDSYVPEEEICLIDLAYCLLQVDDVDPVSLSKDVLFHLRIPSSGLMTEMDSCFQKLLH